MNRRISTIATVAALGVVAPVLTGCDEGGVVVPVTGAGAEALTFVDGESLDAKILAYLTAKGVPGATVAITKDSRLVWAKGYGYADATTKQLMQPETRARIGSTSKFLTTVGAMQLVEDGRIDLDQHVYAPSAIPLWGADQGATPGVVFAPGGKLADPGAFFDAMVQGVDNLSEYFPPSEHLDDMPSLNWALLNQAAYEQQIETTLERASDVTVRNLLSHTAGFPKSGKGAKEAAAELHGISVDDVTEAQQHQAFLMGLSNAGAPWVLDPGTEEKYSNQGFSVAGHVVSLSSDEGDYRAYIENHVLTPLGLDHVVPSNADISELDAQPHDGNNVPYAPNGDGLNPTSVSRLGLATGGWVATARDLTRVMCAIDDGSNNLRALDPETVELMAADAAPAADKVNPLGWDSSSATEQTKNGDVTGGGSRISKFLPGAFDSTDGEINVAMVVNKGDAVPSSDFLRSLAALVAETDIPEDYDLFDPEHACYVKPTFDVTVPSPTPHPDPDSDPQIALPADSPSSDPTPTPETTDNAGIDAPDEPATGEPDPTNPGRRPPGPAVLDLRLDAFCTVPAQTLVTARVNAPAGVGTVQLDWMTDDQQGSLPMIPDLDQDPGVWTGTLASTEGSAPPKPGPTSVIEAVITATDSLGRTATGEVLHECPSPRGELGLAAPTGGTDTSQFEIQHQMSHLQNAESVRSDRSQVQFQIQVATSDLQ